MRYIFESRTVTAVAGVTITGQSGNIREGTDETITEWSESVRAGTGETVAGLSGSVRAVTEVATGIPGKEI